MQISLKLIRGINKAKSTVCIKFQFLLTFSSLFTASSSLSVFGRSVLYMKKNLHVFAILKKVRYGWTDGQTDGPSNRDARTHLKIGLKTKKDLKRKGDISYFDFELIL